MTYEELHELINQADSMPYSKATSQLWAEAAVAAAEGNFHEEYAQCLIELVNSYRMGGELTRLIAPFLQLQQHFQQHREAFDADKINSLAWCYRYAVEAMWSVPEVPAARIRAMIDEAHNFYRELGDSRRAIYQLDWTFAKNTGDAAGQHEAYNKWMNAELTDISNCAACDPEYEVRYLIEKGEWEAAIAHGTAAIESDGPTCAGQPHSMLTELLEPYLKLERFDDAWNAHLRAFRRIYSEEFMLAMLPAHLKALARISTQQRPQAASRAWDVFTRFIPKFAESESPRMLFDFAMAGAAVCAVQDPDAKVSTVLPGADLRWEIAPTLENATAAEVGRWCYDLAQALAQRFDGREGITGTPHSTELVDALAGLSVPAPQTDVADISGLFLDDTKESPSAGYPSLGDVRAAHSWSDDELRVAHDTSGLALSSYRMRLEERGVVIEESCGSGENADALEQAQQLLAKKDFMAAAQHTDAMLRRDPATMADPVGIRFRGLLILAEAARAAGYRDEAVETLRDAINLAAAAGLASAQLWAATTSAEILRGLRRIDEACNVLYGALVAAEHLADNPNFRDLLVRAREIYIDVLAKEDNHYSAAQQELILAPAKDPTERPAIYLSAARNLRHDRCIQESDDAALKAIAAADETGNPVEMAAMRDQVSLLLGLRPWRGTDEEVVRIRDIQARRREIILANLGMFPNLTEAIVLGDSAESLAYAFHSMERYEEAAAELDAAVEVFTSEEDPYRAVGLLLDLSDNRLNDIERTERWVDKEVVQDWLSRAETILESVQNPAIKLVNRVKRLRGRLGS